MTQKRIFFLVLLASLLLAACVVDVKQADPKTRALQIEAWAFEGGTTRLTIHLADGEEVTDSASSFVWHYDVPADQAEYLLRNGSSY